MNNPRLSAAVVVALAIAVLSVRQPATEPAIRADAPVLTVTESSADAAPQPLAAHLRTTGQVTGEARQIRDLRLADGFPAALQALAARSLDSDPLRVTAHEDVRSVCALVHQPDTVSGRVDLDPNRRPWLDQLQRRCAGLGPNQLLPLEPTRSAVLVWRAQVPETVAAREGEQAALRQSMALLGSSVDTRLLYAALRYALVEQQLPLATIFAGRQIPVQADIELTLVNAADWIACARSDSCGSDGLWTHYQCAQFGCPPGIDFPVALQRNSPQWQFEIAQALTRWALSLERDSGG